ncbi:MAG: copper resistance CopC family protein [Acidimicrobiales bacterium]
MSKVLPATVFALAVAVLLALPARAHTAMLRASPDRNATAGGSIAFIDLNFLDPVTNASVTVTYNGTPVAGRATVADGEVITFTLDQPLTQPGRYQVSYEMTSFDGDFTTGGYFFTFDPAAEQVGRIEFSGSSGFSTTTLALSGAGLIMIVGLLAVFVRRIDSGRREALGATDDYGV